MNQSRFLKNPFEDFKPEFAKRIPEELAEIRRTLESKNFFLPFLDQIDASYEHNDVYVGKHGILLFYYFLQKKFPQFRENLIKFYSSCIAKYDKKCHSLISFHCGDCGVFSIEAVVQHFIFKDQRTRDEYLAKLVTCFQDAINPNSKNYDEMLYGRVSLLYALCFVEDELKQSINIEELENVIKIEDCKRQLVQKILNSGVEGRRQLSEDERLLSYHYSWHGKEYCGAAHGYAGIYYILIKNLPYFTPEQQANLVKSGFCLIQTQLLRNGNMTSKLNDGKNDLVQWCHGAPGFLSLISELYSFCESSEQFRVNCPIIQRIAENCLDACWNYGILTKGLNLCHGTAGNGYAFLTWYRLTGDKKSLYRAIQFAKHCLNFNEKFMLSDRPLSLYEGLAGTIYFLVDILDPDNSRFPGFEL